METTTQKIDFLKSCFGENHKLSRDGKNISFICPNCGDSKEKYKFSICLESLLCHCWVCSIKGKTPYNIIKKYVSPQLADKFNRQFSIKSNKVTEEAEIHVTFPGEYRMFSSMNKLYDPDVRDCLKYLKRRGINKRLLIRHKIGIINKNSYSRRVVFPSFDDELNLNFFVTRAIDEDTFIKYRNCKANKTEIIFDEYRLDWSKELVLVEGVFDLVKCPENATCLLGSTLSENSLLFRKIVSNSTPIVLALDSDMIHKSYAIAQNLNSYNVRVKICWGNDT
jgi:predicted RNA-binding Zn-ribbon protein involved in translation (DUF1610 family)